MCRWLAYSGSPLSIHDLLYRPEHSLIDQSLHSTMGAETTNGDGFGIGWYGVGYDEPGVFHSVEPAWNDRNLRDMAQHIISPLVFAHIRASTGTAVQETNCHPFRHGNWLWMHNGGIREFHDGQARPRARRRPVPLSVDRGLDRHRGLLLPRADVRARGRPAEGRRGGGRADRGGRTRHGVEHPIQMTVATTRRRQASGRSATRASATPGRSSTRPTCRRCASCIRTLEMLRG